MAKASKGSPARKPPEPQALHLTASMRVLRAHQHRPALTVQDAHDAVKELALRLGSGTATREDQALEEKLRKATGVEIAELARHAEDWPDNV
jgi:rRNA-processing protein FCF1